ncbi:MAG: galactose-1-phosphate uridylyltransferase [Thermofilaceae archaeon]
MEETYNELRWNPLLGAWIVVSSKRKGRPWRSGGCPFCPGAPETGYGWDVLTLDNRFPALRMNAKTSRGSNDLYKVKAGYGYCKVIIETSQHEGDLSDIPFENIVKYIQELSRVTKELCSDPEIQYVIPFRNKGEVIGVSLTHPHSQVYALPFIPPRVQQEVKNMKRYWEKKGGCLLCRILELEKGEGVRLLYANDSFTAFLPFFAMWPYEVHVYPNRHVSSLTELNEWEVFLLADILKVTTAMYNNLFSFSLPYMLIFHQKPCKLNAEYYHLHLEFYPLHRDKDKLKYAAGIEWGAWTFTYDSLPEEKAAELREALKKGVAELCSKGYEVRGKIL